MLSNKHFDYPLFVTIFLLLVLGLIIQYSLSSVTFTKQLIFILIGLGLFFLAVFLDYRVLNSYTYIFYGLILILLLAVLFFGQTFRGTRGWLSLPFLNLYFQPVELTKLILIIVLAKFWSEKEDSQNVIKNLAINILLFLPLLVLILLQPDFGSAFLLIILWLGMIFMAIRWIERAGIGQIGRLGLIVIVIFLLIFSSWFFLKDYQKERVLTFLNPERDPLGRGYQITQAIIAIGSGSFFGRGLGLGPQSQLHFLPEARTDFIFSVLAEELGFLGAIFVLGLYGFLFYRIFCIAKSATDNFSLFLVLGLGLLFFSQIFVNISMNLGLLPIIGISLPFLSYGGSALVVNLMAVGILESVVKHQIR
jgi:rod shape determining protein RodA